MKKIFSLCVLVVVLLTGCGASESKLETVTYGMDSTNGVTLNMEIKYDKDKHVQETITKNTYNYKEMGMNKEQVKEYIEKASTMYKDMSGVTDTIEYGNEEAKETLKIIVKDVSKESLPVLYSINANDDGTVSLDTLTKNFEASGFKKINNKE